MVVSLTENENDIAAIKLKILYLSQNTNALIRVVNAFADYIENWGNSVTTYTKTLQQIAATEASYSLGGGALLLCPGVF